MTYIHAHTERLTRYPVFFTLEFWVGAEPGVLGEIICRAAARPWRPRAIFTKPETHAETSATWV
ncbi:hypothetical protein RSAG8_06207, partial [Rhizoctonia solani AG-8 WAC10335]